MSGQQIVEDLEKTSDEMIEEMNEDDWVDVPVEEFALKARSGKECIDVLQQGSPWYLPDGKKTSAQYIRDINSHAKTVSIFFSSFMVFLF